MSIVSYDGCSIEPAPFVTVQKAPIVVGNQRKIGTTYQIVLKGDLVAGMGSPQAGTLTGANWGGPLSKFWIGAGYAPVEFSAYNNHLNNLMEKKEALEALFATDGFFLIFQSQDGSTPYKAQIKDCVLTFDEGTWFNIIPYTVTAITDAMTLNGNPAQDATFPDLIQNCEEKWDLQPAEIIKTFNVTHSVSAVGKRSFTISGNELQSPWQNARDFVNNRLVLGWSGSGIYAPDNTQNIFNHSSLGSGVINFGGLSPYNFARVESVDEFGGSYSVVESWVAAVGSGTDVYNVTVNEISEDPLTTTVVGIQGVLRGFYNKLFDYDTRMLGAEWMWSQLQASGLYNRVSSYVTGSGLVLNQQPLGAVLDYNPQEGSITYNFTYSNRLFTGDAFESFIVSRKTNMDDYKSVFTINGQVKGRRYLTDTDPTISFTRASTLWTTLYVGTGVPHNDPSVFYNRIISSIYFPEASGMGLQPAPIDKSIDMNQSEGSITYSFSFNNRLNLSGINSNIAEEDFSISSNFNKEEGITHYTINGTVKGLNTVDTSPQSTKFTNASGYFYNYVVPNLYTRVANYYGVSLPNKAYQSLEIMTQPIVGIIVYSYGFNNMFPPLIAGALSETITVSESNPSGSVNVIASIPIIGRNSGPINQSMGTSENKTRQLSIETVLSPTGSLTNLLLAWNTKPNYDVYVAQLKPANSYVTSDVNSYDWRRGRYSRNVSWLYQ